MTSTIRIDDDCVVTVHYELVDEDGQQIESSREREPLVYVHGHGMLMAAVEKELAGRAAGDQVRVTVQPDEGYGQYQREQVVQVPRTRLTLDIEPGATVRAQHPDGRILPFRVVNLGDDAVTLDGNHPLAGRTVTFELAVQAVREATPHELERLRRRMEQAPVTP